MADGRLTALLLIFLLSSDLCQSGKVDEVKHIYKHNVFQVETPGRKKDCFYESITQNTSISLFWQVVSNGVVMVTLTKLPDHELYRSALAQYGEFANDNVIKGTYEICIDNEENYFSNRVYIALEHLLIKSWEQAIDDDPIIKQLHLRHESIADSIKNIEYSLYAVTRHQDTQKEGMAYDAYSMENLEAVVNFRSMLALLLIVVTSITQVFFLRRLFRSPSSKHQNL